ncbi:hypothetical protein [Natronoglomus mannanivorans]|uniref:Uncharacterized protein n=1 Tax=Natronoglomus mannanivorans TaxID=2979990 RepID=A0AAP3E399_9EURY|nr:hypothetical protein [Halobacteria archaeon AArc-xg1-1]
MAYGSNSVILTRTGATPEDFGLGEGGYGGSYGLTYGTTTADSKLNEFVDQLRGRASDEVNRYCDRVFDHYAEHVDAFEGNGRRSIRLRNYPVTEIHSVMVGSSTLDESEYQLQRSPANPTENAGVIERKRGVWPRTRDVVITYDWGYETTPPAIDSVVEDMVVTVLNEATAERNAAGVQSESMDGHSVTWSLVDAQERLTLTEAHEKKLDRYKRVGMA